MSENLPTVAEGEKRGLTKGVIRRFIQLLFFILLQALILFLATGRLTYGEGWAYLGQYVGFIILNAFLMLPRNKDLIEERSRGLQNTFAWDRILMVFYTLLGPSILLVAGLDDRFGWTPEIGVPIQVAAWVLMGLEYGLIAWAMATNRYFSAAVRIQEERGHHVVTGGPYRFVRHPGYSGIIVYSLVMPLMFGSWWAFIPAILLAVVVLIRTILEDRTLQRELEGYISYARQVRYRLIPGIW
jgi:protein-S-isoprenylcysteine O-methyltransferase Ste14